MIRITLLEVFSWLGTGIVIGAVAFLVYLGIQWILIALGITKEFKNDK